MCGHGACDGNIIGYELTWKGSNLGTENTNQFCGQSACYKVPKGCVN